MNNNPADSHQHVSWVRLAMQQLLARGSLAILRPQLRSVCEELAVGVFKPWRSVMARDKPLGFADAVAEVRRNDVELRHTHMQPLKRRRVGGC